MSQLYTVYIEMEFSLSTLHGLEDKIQKLSDSVSEKVKCGNLEKLNRDSIKLKNLTKETLAEIVVNMGSVINDCRTVLRSASVKFEELNHDLLASQKKVIQTQKDYIACQSDKIDSVQQTVKSEIKNYSEAVKKHLPVRSAITPAKLKQVVKSAITDDNRLKNIMIFGVDEEKTFNDEPVDDAECVTDIFDFIKQGDKLKNSVDKIIRVGEKKEAGSPRPLKVCMRNVETAQLAIKHGKLLRQFPVNENEGYSVDFRRVFISPDRTPEERDARRTLVKEMKDKIKDNPSIRYVIKGGKVCVSDE